MRHVLTTFLTIALITMSSCKNISNVSDSNLTILKDSSRKCLFNRILSKNPYRGDTIKFNNFDEYIEFIPEINLEDNSKTERIQDEIKSMLNKCNYGLQDGSIPESKIVRDKFVAIIYTVPVEGDLSTLVTFDRFGNKIDEITVYEFGGYFTLDTTYRKEEKCVFKIDENLNMHFRHDTSLLIKMDKSKSELKDTVYLNDYEEYYSRIDVNGKIIKK